jgi:hypothetical protein
MKVVLSKASEKNASKENRNKMLAQAIRTHMFRSGQKERIDEARFHTKDTTKRKLKNIERNKKIKAINRERDRKRNKKTSRNKEVIITHDAINANNSENLEKINLTEEEN